MEFIDTSDIKMDELSKLDNKPDITELSKAIEEFMSSSPVIRPTRLKQEPDTGKSLQTASEATYQPEYNIGSTLQSDSDDASDTEFENFLQSMKKSTRVAYSRMRL